MVKHHQPPQHVYITIMPTVAEFANHRIQKLRVNVNDTWDAVLQKHKVNLDPELHCLKSPNLAQVILMHERIGDYIAQYKKRLETYKVKITKMTKTDKFKINEKLKNHVIELQRKPVRLPTKKQKSTPFAEIRKVQEMRPNSNLNGTTATTAPTETPRFLEDLLPQMPVLPNLGVTNEPNATSNQFNVTYIDDCSQDSQDPGDDIKSAIMEKMLKCMTNGDMHRVRQELITLKEKETFMKVSRYIPTTLTMLQYIFAE